MTSHHLMLVVNPDMDVAAADLSSNLVELLKQVHAVIMIMIMIMTIINDDFVTMIMMINLPLHLLQSFLDLVTKNFRDASFAPHHDQREEQNLDH